MRVRLLVEVDIENSNATRERRREIARQAVIRRLYEEELADPRVDEGDTSILLAFNGVTVMKENT